MHYNVHTHRFSGNEEIVELVSQYPREADTSLPYFTVGIHPWYINEDQVAGELNLMEQFASLQNCRAIGECGLDKRIETALDVQQKVLVPQFLLAEKYKKPVILHCVAAYQELIVLKKQLRLTVPLVIHGFSKNARTAESLWKNGFYLSFGKHLLLNPQLGEALKTVPLQQLFLETDTMEQSIFEVYGKAESVLNRNLETIIEDNFNKVFNP